MEKHKITDKIFNITENELTDEQIDFCKKVIDYSENVGYFVVSGFRNQIYGNVIVFVDENSNGIRIYDHMTVMRDIIKIIEDNGGWTISTSGCSITESSHCFPVITVFPIRFRMNVTKEDNYNRI